MNGRNHHIKVLKSRGWNAMRFVLDQEMPQRINSIFFYRISAAMLLLFICAAVGYWGWYKDVNPGEGIIVNNEYFDDPDGSVSEIQQGGDSNMGNKGKDNRKRGIQPITGTSEKPGKGTMRSLAVNHHFPDASGPREKKESANLRALHSDPVLLHDISGKANVGQDLPVLEKIVPIIYSPIITTGKVNLSIKVNKYYDSTRKWPKARIKPSLFTGTVWAPTRSIGFLNIGGGINFHVDNWSVSTGIALTKLLSRDFQGNQYVNLARYDEDKNIVSNVFSNQMDLNFQLSGEKNESGFTRVKTRWGFLLPFEITWRPGSHLGYRISSGVYILRSQSREIYSTTSMAEYEYVSRIEYMPYLGTGVDYSLGTSYTIGIESNLMDALSDEKYWSLGANFSYRF